MGAWGRNQVWLSFARSRAGTSTKRLGRGGQCGTLEHRSRRTLMFSGRTKSAYLYKSNRTRPTWPIWITSSAYPGFISLVPKIRRSGGLNTAKRLNYRRAPSGHSSSVSCPVPLRAAVPADVPTKLLLSRSSDKLRDVVPPPSAARKRATVRGTRDNHIYKYPYQKTVSRLSHFVHTSRLS